MPLAPNRPFLLVRTGPSTWPKCALAVLGYGADSPITIRAVTATPKKVEIGEKVRIEVELENPSEEEARALVDLRVHFVKPNGATRPKVFKGAELLLKAGGSALVLKSISLAQHSTRKHYPGAYRVEVMLNGTAHPGDDFEVRLRGPRQM